MSGPVSTDDAPTTAAADVAVSVPEEHTLEIGAGRPAEVGGFGVVRLLPRRPRRTVGAWCFVDHLTPGDVSGTAGLDIGPHPHIGLQTVTWLVEGAVLHRDSLGSEQLIRPGQLNLMTAGAGVSHSEETSGVHTGWLHGVQLWIAQPSETRTGPPAFEHLKDLPVAGQRGWAATVLIGELAGATSPARCDTDLVGAELNLTKGRGIIPVDARFEHALVVLEGAVVVGGQGVEPGRLAYLGVGRDELVLEVPGAGSGPAHRRGALSRAADDVVELRGPYPRGDRGRPPRLVDRILQVRDGRLATAPDRHRGAALGEVTRGGVPVSALAVPTGRARRLPGGRPGDEGCRRATHGAWRI